VNILARFFSVVFHPLLLATYLVAILAIFLPSALYPISIESAPAFLRLIFLLTFVLPLVNVSFFRIFGAIRSFAMESRSERVMPFTLITLLYGVFTYMVYSRWRVGLDDSLLKILIIIDCLVLVATLITVFYKVSVHSLGIAGVIGILLPLNKAVDNDLLFVPMLVAIVVAGLVMAARLQLNAHSPRETLVGAITGFSVGFFGMIFLF
jgi:membrane-associated phospholipid phosphatase